MPATVSTVTTSQHCAAHTPLRCCPPATVAASPRMYHVLPSLSVTRECRVHVICTGSVRCCRPGGKERQHRSVCVNCGLLLAYRCHKKSDDVYLVNGAFLMQDEDSGVSRLGGPAATGFSLIQKKPVEASSTDAMSAQQEEMMADKKELDANYDSNARVIQMMLNRDNGNKRGAAEPVVEAQPTKVRRKGTLLS